MRYWIFKCWRASTHPGILNNLSHSLLWPASAVPLGHFHTGDPPTIPVRPPEVGDRVALLRTGGRRSAIVATGSVAENLTIQGNFRSSYSACRVSPDDLMFDSPILWDKITSDPEFIPISLNSEGGGFDGGDPPTEIDSQQWDVISRYCADRRSASPETLQWKIKRGQVLDRGELHDVYGGMRTGSISSSGSHPHVFVFQQRENVNGIDENSLQSEAAVIDAPSRDVASLTHHFREGRALRLFRYIDETRQRVQYCGLYRISEGDPIVEKHQKEVTRTRQFPLGRDRRRSYKDTVFRYLVRIQPAVEVFDLYEASTQEVRLGSFAVPEQDTDPNSCDSAILQIGKQEIRANAGSIGSIARSISEALARTQVMELLRDDRDGKVLIGAIQVSARLANLKSAVAELQDALDRGVADESFYQGWCESHSWALGNAYSSRDDVRNIALGDQVDLLMRNTANGLRDIFELKRPDRDPLGWDKGHKSYYWTTEASKAIGQCHRYLDAFQEVARNGLRDNPHVVAYHPRVFIIQGRSAGWGEGRLRALHGLNSRLHGVQLMTYDQLLAQARRLVDVLTTESGEG